MSVWRARAAGAAACLALLGLLVGLPAALLAVGATPSGWSRSLPAGGAWWDVLTGPDDGTLALAVLGLVAWAAWLFLTGCVLLDLVGRARRAQAPTLPGLHVPQAAVHGLVGTALLLFTAATPAAAPAHATTPDARPAATSTVTPNPAIAGTTKPTAGTSGTRHSQPDSGKPVSYTVRAGDTLWGIAEDRLGDGQDYVDIAAANRAVLDRGPDHIDPGMRLHIPTAGRHVEPAPRGFVTHEVQPGDTLWELAETQLGAGHRYPEIADASRGIVQRGGAHLRDPDVIRIGWQLRIPTALLPIGDTDSRSAAGEQPTTPASDEDSAGAQPPKVPPQRWADALDGEDAGGAATRQPGGEVDRAEPTRQPTADPAADTTTSTAWAAPSAAPGWLLAGLTGAGALLAGSMLMRLERRRRTQQRARRPGHRIPVPDPGLAPVEKTLVAVGGLTAPTVAALDTALRLLAADVASACGPMPAVAAVELTAAGEVVLHLARPAETLPGPWQADNASGGRRWSAALPAPATLAELGSAAGQPAPFPLLVTVGAADDGAVWLLNLEGVTVTVSGDVTFAADFARHLAADVACHPWAAGVDMDCVGVASEVAPMEPDRITCHPAGTDRAGAVLAAAVADIDRAADAGVDTATARALQVGADAWHPRLLLVDVTTQHDLGALPELLDTLAGDHNGHPAADLAATSVVVLGAPTATQQAATLRVQLTGQGRLLAPDVGLDLSAVGLTSDETAGCAAVRAAADVLDDTATPTPHVAAADDDSRDVDDVQQDHDDVGQHDDDTHDDVVEASSEAAAHDNTQAAEPAGEGWREFVDQTGALRGEHTMPRDVPAVDGDAASVLPRPDRAYVAAAATTAEDLAALAPRVRRATRDAVQAADPHLDSDVEAWLSGDTSRPRLAVLGPVKARTRGQQISSRLPYYTELLTYLWSREHGATRDETAAAMKQTPARTSTDISLVRKWLGVDPRTGTDYLPDARLSPAAARRGVGVYQVSGLLVDADLFRRLRSRGQARGPAGIDDLITAMSLVTGPPFHEQRKGGWEWLTEGDRLDHHLTCAIVDTAHLVATHALDAGDAALARRVTETAMKAAPYEEIPRLDLVAVATAEGRHDEADRILRVDIANRSDDDEAPDDLPPRTEQVLQQREWLAS